MPIHSPGRHHPQNWMLYGVQGAEMVFNPNANTGDDPSENSWYVEARTAAIANSYYTFAVNRVGTVSEFWFIVDLFYIIIDRK